MFFQLYNFRPIVLLPKRLIEYYETSNTFLVRNILQCYLLHHCDFIKLPLIIWDQHGKYGIIPFIKVVIWEQICISTILLVKLSNSSYSAIFSYKLYTKASSLPVIQYTWIIILAKLLNVSLKCCIIYKV